MWTSFWSWSLRGPLRRCEETLLLSPKHLRKNNLYPRLYLDGEHFFLGEIGNTGRFIVLRLQFPSNGKTLKNRRDVGSAVAIRASLLGRFPLCSLDFSTFIDRGDDFCDAQSEQHVPLPRMKPYHSGLGKGLFPDVAILNDSSLSANQEFSPASTAIFNRTMHRIPRISTQILTFGRAGFHVYVQMAICDKR